MTDLPHRTKPVGVEFALQVAERFDAAVFPVGKEVDGVVTKQPKTPHGYKDAVTEPDEIRALWKRYGDSLIGVACGDSMLVVGDIDNPDLISPDLGFIFLIKTTLTLESLTKKLPHHVYRGAINTIHDLPGVDIQSIGSYIIVAVDEDHPLPEGKIADLPDELVEYFAQQRGKSKESVSEPGNGAAPGVDLDAWLDEHTDRFSDVAVDAFLNVLTDHFDEKVENGTPRRMAMRDMVFAASKESSEGAFGGMEAFDTLEEHYEASRDVEKPYNRERKTDYRRCWSDAVAKIERGDFDDEIAEARMENGYDYTYTPGEAEAEEKPRVRAEPTTAPEFPIKAFPPDAREYAEGIAGRKQVPLGLVAPLMLAGVAAATAGGVVVEAPDGYQYGLSAYVVGVADPSERKSSIIGSVIDKPLRAAFDAKAKDGRVRRAEAEALVKTLTAEASVADKTGDVDAMTKAALAVMGAEEDLKALKPPRYIVTDPSVEALEVLMMNNQGSALIASAEGAFVENLTGRHGENVSMALINDGWSRGPVFSIRITRGETDISVAHLCLALLVQKSVAEKFNDEKFERTGFLSRVFFTAPEPMVGKRQPILETTGPFGKQAWWESTVKRVLYRGWGMVETPHVLQMSPGAVQVWAEFFRVAESRAVSKDFILGWWSKAAEMVARVAGLLTLMDNPNAVVISPEMMSAGVKVVEFFAAEAQLFYTGVLNPELGKDGANLRDRIVRLLSGHMEAGDEYTSSDLAKRLKGSRTTVTADDVTWIHEEVLVPDGLSEGVAVKRTNSKKWRYLGGHSE